MQDEADSVIDQLGGAECLVAALMGNHPHACTPRPDMSLYQSCCVPIAVLCVAGQISTPNSSALLLPPWGFRHPPVHTAPWKNQYATQATALATRGRSSMKLLA